MDMDMTSNEITQTTAVSFRVEPNGGYHWMSKGLTRGYWRIQVLANVNGSTNISSRNVISQRGTHEGIRGVTSRSRYYIGDIAERLIAEAAAENAARDAEWNRRAHRAE